MIGIYDSGIGGISILKRIKYFLPKENFLYIADQKFFPYGNLPVSTIKERNDRMCSWFESKNVKMVVIACNTATVSALSHLRRQYPSIPIVGTVPVIKKCAEFSKNGNIGVICTPKTARSRYQKNLIAEFAASSNIYIRSCPYLVEAIEAGDLSRETLVRTLERPLRHLKQKNIDVLALGCSHFPLINDHIQKFMGKNVLVLDSADAIARQVKKILKNNGTLSKDTKLGQVSFFTTGNPKKFDIIGSKYWGRRIKSKKISI